MNAKKNKKIVIFIVACLLLLSVGFTLLVTSFKSARQYYQDEYDTHITTILDTVDHNITQLLDRFNAEFGHLLSSVETRHADEKFLESNDATLFKKIFNEGIKLNKDIIYTVIITKDDEIIFNTKENDSNTYTFIKTDPTHQFITCKDQDGNEYIAYTKEGRYGLQYNTLLELTTFYETVVPDSVLSQYWIVIYDYDCNLFMHNELNNPTFLMLSREEILARNDGFTFLLQAEESQKDDFITYMYTNAKGKTAEGRILTKCSSNCHNGIFSLTAGISNDAILYERDKNTVKMILATVLLVTSIAIGIELIIHSAKNQKIITKKLELLAEKNKLDEQIIQHQKELAHHQKMETIGLLTAGVAHEFNNLLTPILGFSMSILENTEETSDNYDSALEVYQASIKAKKLVNRITRLSGKNIDESSSIVDMKAVVKNALSLASHSIKKEITVCDELEDNCTIYGNAPRLEQMVLNLLMNSVQAFEGGIGRIDLSVKTEGENIVLCIKDNGPGIPDDVKGKIFEPFFTTKDPNKGTGLGLAIVDQTVTDHNGTIDLKSQPGETQFTITFPKASE